MRSEFGGGFGKDSGNWNSPGAGNQSWNGFGEDNSGTAASFGDLKPAAGKRILKAALIIFALLIVAGVTAVIIRVTGHRSREKAARYVISQGAQEEKGLNQAGENGELQGSAITVFL